MKGIFVTGTDTGVGKTHIGVRVIRQLRQQGLHVTPRKPVESGCELKDLRLVPADAQALNDAAGNAGLLSEVCPHCFQPPISPRRAAKLANIVITTEHLVAACHPPPNTDFLLVEGAGGFYSPLTIDGLNADLAQALQLPILLVAADRLGCLNHILLTTEAISRRGLKLLAIVLNRADGQPDKDTNNHEDLLELVECPVFAHPHAEANASTGVDEKLIQLLISDNG